MGFVKRMFGTKPFTLERYTHYKEFKNKVMNKSFSNRSECITMANDISPGLGMTQPIETISQMLNLQ
jgi:hypothetical protein